MNSINRKSLIVSVIAGLILPLVLGGLLTAFGLQPQFNFIQEGKGLSGLFSSSQGIGVYLVTAVLFCIACLLPELTGNQGAGAEESELDEADDREDGEVKWFNPNKGYGFITRSNGEEIFAHFRSIQGRGHRTLRQGQKVKFKAVEGEKGLQAEDISSAEDQG